MVNKKQANIFKKGFTLIELAIVVAIIAVLAGAFLTIVNPMAQLAKARDAKRKGDLYKIKLLLEQYYNDNNKYPPAGTYAYGEEYRYVCSTNSIPWLPALVPQYTKTLPVDPINNTWGAFEEGQHSYCYGNVSADGQHFDLVAQFENVNDSLRCGVQNYTRTLGWPPGEPWCIAFGGIFSNNIYAIDL